LPADPIQAHILCSLQFFPLRRRTTGPHIPFDLDVGRAIGGSMELIVVSVCIREIANMPRFVSQCNNPAFDT
jgi:hypothetical protein